MAKHIPKAFRRATALLTSLLLIAAQMVLPLAALAQDISMLPTVTIQWSAADGSVQSMPVTATLYGDQVVYWASVSEEAMQAGVSIQSITGPEDPQLVTYGPAAGTLLTGNATAVDGSVAASIEVYRGGVFEIAYPFYLSTVAIPPYQPAGPTSGTVYISYRYEGGEEFYGYEDVVPAEGRSFAPDLSLVPDGYELISAGEVFVTLNQDGTTTPNPVMFEVRESEPQVMNSTVTFHHVDDGSGQQITDDTWQELAPETYSASSYQQAVEGYTYSYASPDPFTVDGTGTPVEVTLY